MFQLYTLGAPFIDQPKPGLSFVFSEPRTERGQLFMLLRLLRRLWCSLWNPVLGVGEQLRLFFVSELGWMAGDSDYCVSSAHARLLASELEPLLHDLNASISILLFRMYLHKLLLRCTLSPGWAYVLIQKCVEWSLSWRASRPSDLTVMWNTDIQHKSHRNSCQQKKWSSKHTVRVLGGIWKIAGRCLSMAHKVITCHVKWLTQLHEL